MCNSIRNPCGKDRVGAVEKDVLLVKVKVFKAVSAKRGQLSQLILLVIGTAQVTRREGFLSPGEQSLNPATLRKMS